MTFPLHVIVPGPLDQRTGGYIYDRRIVEGLRDLGWPVTVHELSGRFPDPDQEALDAAFRAVSTIEGGLVLIDGLALLAFADQLERLEGRWAGLIHHPLCMETGLSELEIKQTAALEGLMMPRAKKLIVTSPGTKRDLEQGLGLDPDKIAVIIPGVTPAPLACGSGSGDPTAMLTVGSLTKRKGHLVLLDALARIAELDWRLTIVGSAAWDPGHAARIARTIDELGLADRVEQIGEQGEAGLDRLYDAADMLVLASLHEGYGMVLSEALARGLPIVSTTAGAIPETVPPDAGLLVPPGDAAGLADAIARMLSYADVYASLKAGAEEARQNLRSWEQQAAAFAGVLERIGPS